MQPIIRLEKIELQNFKNIEQGLIESIHYKNKLFYTKQADIIGIYGQNGSGKTTVVESLELLKVILSGERLPKDVDSYIRKNSEEAVLKFIFYIEDCETGDSKPNRYIVYYEVAIRARKEESVNRHMRGQDINRAFIARERLSFTSIGQHSKIDILHYEETSEDIFLPKSRYLEVTRKNPDHVVNLSVAKRYALQEVRSFIFQQEVMTVFQQATTNPEYGYIMKVLNYYAKMNLIVISKRVTDTACLQSLPFSFRFKKEQQVACGEFSIALVGASFVREDSYYLVCDVIQQLNTVIASILPHLQLEVKDLGVQLNSNTDILKQIELLSVKHGVKVPLKYESEGIKKIISILSALIAMYNDPSCCVVIDELDAGVFEYLLGELLSILETRGRGQLIFTSHNLRPLEKLHKEAIVISTTNSQNRFVRIPHDKRDKNFRNVYLRSIDLGGLEEEIYESTNRYEIAYALEKAGELFEAK